MRVAVVGTGLIGGSFALALKRAGAATQVTGWDARPEAAEAARARGIVDRVAPSLATVAEGADAVVVAVPVRASEAVFSGLAPSLDDAALVTDVGSVKAPVVAEAARALPRPERFVGAHPLAGTERSGPEAADGALFQRRTCLLTPLATTDRAQVARCRALWEAAGARVREMEPEAHDRALAFTSHLPHAVAFALAAAVGEAPGTAGLSGGGFVDTTRIAGSDPAMWRDIFLDNRAAVLEALAGFEALLGALRDATARGDAAALELLVARARAGRRRVLEEGA